MTERKAHHSHQKESIVLEQYFCIDVGFEAQYPSYSIDSNMTIKKNHMGMQGTCLLFNLGNKNQLKKANFLEHN